MSKAPIGRGGAAGTGTKWVSGRVAQQATVPAASSPVTATPTSAPHAAGGHGFEDSAVNEHARRVHSQQAPEESTPVIAFGAQDAADILSNLSCFRDEYDQYKSVERKVQPATGIRFHEEVLSKIKPVK